jgi:hypothetical protein
MQQIRSSQSLTLHHHASEHSVYFTIIGSQLTPLPRSDNPSQRTRTNFLLPTRVENINRYTHPDAPKPIHPDKEQFCSSTLKLGANIRFLSIRPLQERTKRKSKLDFPHKQSQPKPSLFTHKWWRWTESNRRPPACKAGALPIELHPQSFVSGNRLAPSVSRLIGA